MSLLPLHRAQQFVSQLTAGQNNKQIVQAHLNNTDGEGQTQKQAATCIRVAEAGSGDGQPNLEICPTGRPL